jgi:hypothetical protein
MRIILFFVTILFLTIINCKNVNIFTGNISNKWSNDKNWSLGRLPKSNDDVFIENECNIDINTDVNSIISLQYNIIIERNLTTLYLNSEKEVHFVNSTSVVTNLIASSIVLKKTVLGGDRAYIYNTLYAFGNVFFYQNVTVNKMIINDTMLFITDVKVEHFNINNSFIYANKIDLTGESNLYNCIFNITYLNNYNNKIDLLIYGSGYISYLNGFMKITIVNKNLKTLYIDTIRVDSIILDGNTNIKWLYAGYINIKGTHNILHFENYNVDTQYDNGLDLNGQINVGYFNIKTNLFVSFNYQSYINITEKTLSPNAQIKWGEMNLNFDPLNVPIKFRLLTYPHIDTPPQILYNYLSFNHKSSTDYNFNYNITTTNTYIDFNIY